MTASKGDPVLDPDSEQGLGAEPDGEATTGAPRWVKVFGIIALVLVLLVGILLLAGGPGGHGPGRHTDGQTPASNVAELEGAGGHTPPSGSHAP